MSQTPAWDDDDWPPADDEPLRLNGYEQPMLDLGLEQLPARREGPHDVA